MGGMVRVALICLHVDLVGHGVSDTAARAEALLDVVCENNIEQIGKHGGSLMLGTGSQSGLVVYSGSRNCHT